MTLRILYAYAYFEHGQTENHLSSNSTAQIHVVYGPNVTLMSRLDLHCTWDKASRQYQSRFM